jgi:transposase InsO family protein
MCQVLEVSRSGYHSWKNRSSSERKISNQSLLEKIKKIHEDQERIPGSPKITEELNAQGIKCSKNRVAKIMKENGIKSKIKRKFTKTTDSDHNLEVAPNIYAEVKSNINAPNQVWLSDITYIWTKEGWLYLAVILDAFTHGVIGWSMSNRITRQLVINAFLMAVYHKNPGQNIIFHSDRGSQYASNEFKDILKYHHFIQSMSGAGNCYDNAMSESFFHSIKIEKIYWNVYETREQAKQSVYEYIELYYNVKRRHSSIDYMSPKNFELKYYNSIIGNVC